MIYRQEIDGLRAIAVVPVILFHAGFDTFNGGYIGVDIFFVISGYLIGSIIIRQKQAGKFKISYFYARRAQRILPALSFVVFSSSIFAWIFLNPADLKFFSQSIAAVATFSSNVLFYLQSGYFSPASNEIPLLHTWSLAIEEQFYIIFPALISLFWFLKRRHLVILIASIGLLSLMATEFLSDDLAEANFYLIHSRAWELVAGVLLVFIPIPSQPITSGKHETLSLLGFLLLIVSFIVINETTPAPSFYTLIPVAGVALIIIYGNKQTLIGRLLGQRVFVFIGLISYSLYLWHQPLLAFLHLKTVGQPSVYLKITTLALIFPLAYLTWKYIEKPFRRKNKFSQKQIFIFSATTMSAFLVAGIIGHVNNGFASRFPSNVLSKTTLSSPKRDKCHTKGNDYLLPAKACRYFGEDINWAILGDSHVTEIGFALAEELKKTNNGLLHLSFSDCPPALLFEPNLPGCSQWLKDSITQIVNEKTIKNILIGFRHSYYLYGNHTDFYPELPDLDPRRIMTKRYRTTRSAAEETYWNSFKEIITRLLKANKTVYVLFPVPEIPMDINKAIHPFSIFNSKPLLDLEKSTPLSFYKKRNSFILKKLNTLPYGKRLIAIKPTQVYCTNLYCRAMLNNQALYFDDDHPSIAGARLLSQLFTPYL